MKKYFQITIVLASFFAVVIIKNFRGGDEKNRIIVVPPLLLPSASPTTTPPSAINLPQGSTPPPISVPTATPVPQQTKGQYRDGSYTGSVEDAYYGYVQVKAIIAGGRLIDVQILQYPNDNRTSIRVNTEAMPILRDEAIQAQSADVDIVSGASNSSPAFARSLASALAQAK